MKTTIKTLLWELRDAYWCHRKIGVSWLLAWKLAHDHVKRSWHKYMQPEQAAHKEWYAWCY